MGEDVMVKELQVLMGVNFKSYERLLDCIKLRSYLQLQKSVKVPICLAHWDHHTAQ